MLAMSCPVDHRDCGSVEQSIPHGFSPESHDGDDHGFLDEDQRWELEAERWESEVKEMQLKLAYESLPPHWFPLIDESTGFFYYWNSETDIEQHEKPTLPSAHCHPADLSHPSEFDSNFNFDAPHFFDLSVEESVEDKNISEMWLSGLHATPKKSGYALPGPLRSVMDEATHSTCPQNSETSVTQNDRPVSQMVQVHPTSRSDLQIHKYSKCTKPRPFHLLTMERGLLKEQRFADALLKKQEEEQRRRIPKARPCPLFTTRPTIPFKPVPKEPTKFKIFHLETMTRHKKRIQNKLAEREKKC